MSIFAQIALGQLPRILGLLDRDPASPTFGCGDRYYWHYRFLDFPNVRFQESCLLLVLAHDHLLLDGRYHGSAPLKRWVEAQVRFWLGMRRGNGSCDEAYPFENSFCATAFSALAVSECMLRWPELYAPDIARTGRWLGRRAKPALANQMAAAALALFNLAALSGEEEFLRMSREKLDQVLANQDPSGFFPEYGGWDLGYTSITLSCLAQYWRRSQDQSLLPHLRRAQRFIESRLDDLGRFDSSGSSRMTQFVYPLGLRLLGSPCLERLERGLLQGVTLNPAWLDDRYVAPMATDYLLTHLAAAGLVPPRPATV